MDEKKLKYNDSFKQSNLYNRCGINSPSHFCKSNSPQLNIPGVFSEQDIFFSDKVDVESDLVIPKAYYKGSNVLPNVQACDYRRETVLSRECYWITPNKSEGRGSGQLDANNYLRFQMNSRNLYGEKIDNIEVDRNYVTERNYQSAKNSVLPFPQSGYDTRHLNKMNKYNSMFEPIK